MLNRALVLSSADEGSGGSAAAFYSERSQYTANTFTDHSWSSS
jgi:hypothetical protein